MDDEEEEDDPDNEDLEQEALNADEGSYYDDDAGWAEDDRDRGCPDPPSQLDVHGRWMGSSAEPDSPPADSEDPSSEDEPQAAALALAAAPAAESQERPKKKTFKIALKTVAGQTEVIQELKQARCLKDHLHHPIEGSFKGTDGKWHSLSEYAGGYPAALCHSILKGAEAFCRRQEAFIGDDDNYEFDDTAAELQDGDEAIEEEEQLADQEEEFQD
eukprot:s9333_g1.t1